MNNKYQPIRICSCYQCRYSNSKKFYLRIANRKFRQSNKQILKQFDVSNVEDYLRNKINAGYFS